MKPALPNSSPGHPTSSVGVSCCPTQLSTLAIVHFIILDIPMILQWHCCIIIYFLNHEFLPCGKTHRRHLGVGESGQGPSGSRATARGLDPAFASLSRLSCRHCDCLGHERVCVVQKEEAACWDRAWGSLV